MGWGGEAGGKKLLTTASTEGLMFQERKAKVKSTRNKNKYFVSKHFERSSDSYLITSFRLTKK